MRCKFTDVVVFPYGKVCKTHVPKTAHWETRNTLPGGEAIFHMCGADEYIFIYYLYNIYIIYLYIIIYISCENFNKEHSRFFYRTMYNNFTVTCKFTVSWVSESVCFFLEMSVRQIIDKFQNHKAFHLSVQDKPSEVYNNTAY